MNKYRKLSIVLSTAMLISYMSYGQPSYAAQDKSISKPKQTKPASSNVNVYTLEKLAPIKLSSKSDIKLTDVNILTQNDGNILTYTLNFYNGDSVSLQLNDYWTKVKSNNGTTFSSKLTDKDKEKKIIAPRAQLSLTFYAKIGTINKVSDLKFDLIKWDFSKSGFENRLGTFTIPTNYTVNTPFRQSKKIRVNDIPALTKAEDLEVFNSNGQQYAIVTLSVNNIGFKVLEDPKYAFSLMTPSGTSYELTPDSNSVDYKIQPQDTKKLNLVAVIPSNVKPEQLMLQILQKDETAKANLPIATYNLPSVKSSSLQVDDYMLKEMNINGIQLETKIKTASFIQDTQHTDWSIQFNIRNTGNKTITLPKYQFSLQTQDGYNVPITTKALDNLMLKPYEEKTIRLTATISSYLTQQNLSLQISQPLTAEADNQKSYPIASYKVPYNEQGSANMEYYVENDEDSYGVTLSSIQRLPWIDGDLVEAKLTVSNKGPTTVQLPKLTGALKMDQASLENVEVVASNSSSILGPNGKMDVYVIAKVPSDLSYSQLQISLMQQNGDDKSEFITLKQKVSDDHITEVAKGSSYEIDTSGKKATVKELRTLLYPGVTSNILYTELEMKSEESRQADLSKLVAYYKTKDGQYFQAAVTQVDHSTSPNGKNLVTLWSKLPRTLNVSDLSLYVGEGTNDGKFTSPTGDATGYVNAVNLQLNQQTFVAKKNNLNYVDLFPYSISIPDVSGTIMGSSAQIKFGYHLSRNEEYEMGKFDHKLVVEVLDSSGRYFDRELALDSDLKVGVNQTYSLSLDDSMFENMKGGSFEFALYDQFQGEKIKLASQSFYYSLASNNLD